MMYPKTNKYFTINRKNITIKKTFLNIFNLNIFFEENNGELE
jgi:hypothetical protein